MRVFIGCAVLAIGLLSAMVSAQEAKKGPYDRVASGKAPKKEAVRVYTNADLKKLPEVAAEAGEGQAAVETPATAKGSEKEPEKGPDPLTWLRQRQDAQRKHGKAVSEAEAVLAAAKQQLASLERQMLAARNPFSARPQLSDEEKAERRDSGESASKRYERTQELVEKTREAVRVAEAELVRLRTAGP